MFTEKMLVFIILALSFRFSSSLSIAGDILDPFLGTDSASTASFYTSVLNGLDCGCNRVSNLDVSKIKVYVYNFETNSNATYFIDDAANEILNRSDFNPDQCIQAFIHGFRNTINSTTIEQAKCTFSKIKCDGIKPLALIFDHSEYTNTNSLLGTVDLVGSYKRSVYYAKSIGVKIGEFMVNLLDRADRNKIDIIGHSLGGQIVGYAGETVINNTGTPLERIYAADPAGPCYVECPNEHINSNQARLVVSFHCNARELGSYLNQSHYDFYSRNGQNQEGCPGGSTPGVVLRAAASSCSHGKCVSISLKPSTREGIWKATKCSSEIRYLNDECDNNESSLAGYRVTPTNSTGIYFFTPDNELDC